MSCPDFFDQAPVIRMHDALAAFLGAAEGGIMEYRYADAVRLAGHSCPTVAAAFLMTRAALRALHEDSLPERGGVEVAFGDSLADGVTGVMANVVGLIAGAAQEGGFKGLGGHYDRRGLLRFEVPMEGTIRFRRTDNGEAVEVSVHTDVVPADPQTFPLLRRCVAGEASAGEHSMFRALWQDRVRRMLLDFADNADLITVAPVRLAGVV
ncbi:MAG: FmdE family protein [Gammaproteobacteria bacterium]|nr:FmdE family protein [Gammaproteobacteria bacterium]